MKLIAGMAVLVALLGLGVGTGSPQNFGSPSPERYFRIEAESGQGRGGRPVLRGYIYNNYAAAATQIQLLVENLDGSGQVVGRSLVRADGVVPAFGRLYFDTPYTAGGSSYRASVYYYEWLKGGGGGGN